MQYTDQTVKGCSKSLPLSVRQASHSRNCTQCMPILDFKVNQTKKFNSNSGMPVLSAKMLNFAAEVL
jgi:hypothetical protein